MCEPLEFSFQSGGRGALQKHTHNMSANRITQTAVSIDPMVCVVIEVIADINVNTGTDNNTDNGSQDNDGAAPGISLVRTSL